MAHHTAQKPQPWPWENFSPAELASRGNGAVRIELDALNKLQQLRYAWGHPMTINSAYRDPEYNAKVGGATNSYHKKGMAFDVGVTGWTKQEKNDFKELALDKGFTGFGGYKTFIHIDIGPARKWGLSWAWPKSYT